MQSIFLLDLNETAGVKTTMPGAAFESQLIDELRKMGADVELIKKYKPTIEQLQALREGLLKAQQAFERR